MSKEKLFIDAPAKYAGVKTDLPYKDEDGVMIVPEMPQSRSFCSAGKGVVSLVLQRKVGERQVIEDLHKGGQPTLRTFESVVRTSAFKVL